MSNAGIFSKAGSSLIGGVSLGAVGSSGIYSGYTMAAGDDFNGPLDIVAYTRPLAKYFSTHVYGTGCRSVSGALNYSFDSDPFFSGAQDSNRGVPVTMDTMIQKNSILSLKARIANGGETPHINGRSIVSAMIHTGGYVSASPPCIIEAYCSFTGSPPTGWHPTFWILNSNPLSTPTGTPGWLEFDFPESSSQQSEANTNVHGTVGGSWSNDVTTITPVLGTGYHLFSLVITSSSVLFYRDGTLVKTESHDGTITGNPYYLIFTNHTFNASFGGDSGVDLGAWASAGSTGASMLVDYYRIWIPSANYPANIQKPLDVPPMGLQVNYGSSINYTFPSVSTLWGSVITDYCQAIRKEDFEPGSNSEGSGNYTTPFPTGLTWDSATRNLSGVPTNNSPGRLHIIAIPNILGGVNFAWRDFIDIGPSITTATQNLTNGNSYSHDLYTECNVGTLLPKSIAVTGLPAGLSFDGVSTISGTPTTNGTTSASVSVTNASGQTSTSSISFVVSAAASLSVDSSNTISGTLVNSLSIPLTTTSANELIVLMVAIQGGSLSTITSITASGLTFSKRKSFAWGTGNIEGFEVWYAAASSTFSGNITVNFSATTGPRIAAFSVIGANLTTPWDSNASLPSSRAVNGTGTSIAPSSSLSSTLGNTMFITCMRTLASGGTITAPSGFTKIAGASSAAQAVAYEIFSSTQSGLSPTWSWTTGAQDNCGYWDAIVSA